MAEKDKEEGKAEEKQIEEAFIIKPLDGGYGWIVVLASFLANVIVDGVIFTAGAALLALWQKDFQTSETAVSLTMSILSGSYLLVGPVASALCNLYGCRIVVIIGCILSFFGFVCSTIAPQVYFLYVSFGFVGGVGFGLIYLPAIVVISQYFSEKRSLATGLAVCGSGIGTTLFSTLNPHVMSFMDDNWRLFMVYLAVVSLLPIISAIAFKEVRASKDQIEEATKIAESVASRKNSVSDKGLRGSSEPRPRLNSNRLCLSTVELNTQKSSSQSKSSVMSTHDIAEAVARESVRELNRPLSKADVFYPGSITSLRQRSNTISGGEIRRPRKKSTASQVLEQDGNREHHQSNIYLSTIGLPAAHEGEPVVTQPRTWKDDLKDTLKALLDTSLLYSPSFLILAFSGFLTMTCFYVPFNYLSVMMGKIPDLTPTQKAMPISLLGIFNIVARIACGWIADQPQADALMTSNICIILAGLATFAIPFFTEFWMYIVFCIPFACGVACFAALRSVICVELFGLEKLSNAFGILLTFMGVGAVIGTPIAAMVKDFTGSFDMSFYIMGILMAISGAMGIPLRRLRNWEERRAAKASPEDAATAVELEKLQP